MKPAGNIRPSLLCLSIGIIMLSAGVLKAWEPSAFADILSRRGWIPAMFIPAVAVGLPWIEIVSALTLIFLPRCRAGAALLMSVFFVLFSVELSVGILLGWQAPCGCFGVESQPAGWGHVAMNLALWAGCLMIYSQSMRINPIGMKETP